MIFQFWKPPLVHISLSLVDAPNHEVDLERHVGEKHNLDVLMIGEEFRPR